MIMAFYANGCGFQNRIYITRLFVVPVYTLKPLLL